MHQSSDQEILKEIFSRSLAIARPEQQIAQLLTVDDDLLSWDSESTKLSDFNRIFVFGAGKAGYSMANGLHDLLQDRIHGGVVICPEPTPIKDCKIKFLPGNHPIPDKESFDSTEELIKVLTSTTENDLIFFLISGGASAMLCKPLPDINQTEIQLLNEQLLKSGLSIHEMNRKLKELSAVKGGKLLEFTPSKRIINLLISDVPGNDPNVIGSGPTQANDLSSRDKTISNIWINTPELFAESIANTSKSILKDVVIYIHPLPYSGSTKDVCDMIASTMLNYLTNDFTSLPRLFIFYGESEVKVTGNGKGGRNQHLALHFLIHDMPKFGQKIKLSMMSVGSDGIDGNTEAAGAIIDSDLLNRLAAYQMNPTEYFNQFNSYPFFKELGASVITGPTENNLMDFQLLLVRDTAIE
ncbi:MAG TPA: hypothetical protein DCE78_06320 [Bacteroidetes bacterium]|nr:hypothetical protein [Bacteroidota bacterium]